MLFIFQPRSFLFSLLFLTYHSHPLMHELDFLMLINLFLIMIFLTIIIFFLFNVIINVDDVK